MTEQVKPATDVAYRLSHSTIIIWMVASWLWVGIPLTWGVSQTVISSMALFQPVEAPRPPAQDGK
jgi:hypothetical protein